MIDAAPRRIAFLGFGLIAGSIARALAEPSGDRLALVAWSPSGAGPRAALADRILDAAAADPAAAIEGADLVVIAAPPLETIDLIARLGGPLRGALAPDVVVTDVASTKAAVLAEADAVGVRFVGGHPMAGREVVGYAGSVADLFVDRPWVVVPGAAADDAAIRRVEWLARSTGARPVSMDATVHDAAAAAVSHLPLVLAVALVEAVVGGDAERPGWPVAAGLAASGWRDMTRLARGDARMGAGIAATNAPALLAAVGEVRAALDAWIADLEQAGGPDPERLEARLRRARERLERAPTTRS
ncbi:MAG: Prephenate/arogenate dehydrogenase protein [Chloroflexi bacterium]|nr:Prephenate/arogenate dehydrogenase protein [Chloroflexota bacterium]